MEGAAGQANPESEGQILENSTPAFIVDVWHFGVGFIERYGWFIVFGLIILMFLLNKLKPHWRALQKKWEQQNEIANFDPVRAAAEQEKIEYLRRRWQEQHDAKAAKYVEDKKLLEEEKRRERIEDWDRHQEGKGYRSKKFKPFDEPTSSTGSRKPKKPKPLRESDYSPLSGGGGGYSYRPPRRGGGGGG